jgi:hypothetical protein
MSQMSCVFIWLLTLDLTNSADRPLYSLFLFAQKAIFCYSACMEKREVDRHPAVPELSEQAIKLITKLCFRPDDPIEHVNLIFVFSSPLEPQIVSKLIVDLLHQGISDKVFITGGSPGKYQDSEIQSKPESLYVLERINRTNFPGVRFYSENKSSNTLENVTEALKVLDFRNYKKVMYVFKSHDSQRGYLTLRKFLPDAKLIQRTFSAQYPSTEKILNSETWHTYDFGRTRVWGEFLRIKTYGERGDIAYDQETKNLVNQIEELIK